MDDAIGYGLIPVPPHAAIVTDADEEVFLLYTELAALKPADGESDGAFRGLGFIDNKTDTLTVQITTVPPVYDLPETIFGKGKRKGKSKVKKAEPELHEFELAQDGTALRSRSGDTGSILWKASIDFAQFFLQELRFPTSQGFFNVNHLSKAHILELGAGTGLLSVVLGPHVRRYTATDIPALVPLLRKNISRIRPPPPPSSTAIAATALDWTIPAQRQLSDAVLADAPDVLLVVDCIYHPALVAPLLGTLAALTAPGRTTVLVVAELRAEDVVREFLEGWLGREGEGWAVWSLRGERGHGPLGPRYAVWMGRRRASVL